MCGARVKPVTELTEEELLSLLDSKVEAKGPQQRHDVTDFISVYGIKSGNHKVKIRLLYTLYKIWSKNPIKVTWFTKVIGLLFLTDSNNFVSIDFPALELFKQYEKTKIKSNKTNKRGYKEHFDKYIKRHSIISGGLYIKDVVLFNIYDKWIYSTKNKKSLGLNQLNNFLKLYFKYKLIDGNYWYGLDKSIEQYLTTDLINIMRKQNVTNKKAKN